MKKVNLDIDLGDVKLGEGETKRKLIINVITNLIISYGQQQQGLGFDDQRKVYKVLDAFERADKEDRNEVELEDDWYDFIKKVLKDGKFNVEANRLLNKLYEMFELV